MQGHELFEDKTVLKSDAEQVKQFVADVPLQVKHV
jgi:hypothetical protein